MTSPVLYCPHCHSTHGRGEPCGEAEVSTHVWAVEIVNGGPIGDCDFWTCVRCGASGGPALPKRDGGYLAPWPPFYADGSGLKLPDDCDRAAVLIAEHLAQAGEDVTP